MGKNIIVFGTESLSNKLIKAPSIDNYLGFYEISGEELREKFQDHLDKMEIEITYKKINNDCIFNYSKENNTLYLNCSNNDNIFDISSYISFNTLLVHLNKFNYELNAFDDICTFTKDDEIKCNKGNFDSLGNYYNLLINEYNLLVNG